MDNSTEISAIQSTIYDLIEDFDDKSEEEITKSINISIDEVFDGPLEALYNLVIKRKIKIEEIPLWDVASQLVSYLSSNNEDIELSGDMLNLATKLMYIKSARILKNHQQLEELALQEEVVANELKAKLEEYAKYKEASYFITERMDFVNKSYFKNAPEIIVQEVFSDENINKEEIYKALLRLSELEVEKIKTGMIAKVNDEKLKRIYKANFIKVEEHMEKIHEKLSTVDVINVSEYTNNYSKGEKIATFLALLEMCKSRDIYAEQESAYSDIFIRKRDVIEKQILMEEESNEA